MLESIKQSALIFILNTCENELISRILILSFQMQSLTLAALQYRYNRFNLIADNTVISDRQIDVLIIIAEPYQS